MVGGRRGEAICSPNPPRLPPPTASGVGKLFRDPRNTQAEVTNGLGTFLTPCQPGGSPLGSPLVLGREGRDSRPGCPAEQPQGLRRRDPAARLTVVTGPSGSGKSSLAFDTIYAEGQRRYVESLSAYARQFLERMEKPDVDGVDGVSPAVAIEQKNPTRTSRSTVGTATEIYDYLRLLWARVGRTFCPRCGRELKPDTVQSVSDRLLATASGDPVRRRVPAQALGEGDGRDGRREPSRAGIRARGRRRRDEDTSTRSLTEKIVAHSCAGTAGRRRSAFG